MIEHKVLPDGRQEWWQNYLLHREDGPAVIYPDGTQKWYQNGIRHREGGPAIILPDGKQYWYQNGRYLGTDDPNIPKYDWVKEGF